MYAECATFNDKVDLCRRHGILISYLDESKRLTCTAGTILKWCVGKIDSFRSFMNRQLCVFKIGMTANPLLRFHFYSQGNYTSMSLLHVTKNMEAAQMLEAALIQMHISEQQCRNERLGGEGPPTNTEVPHFVYIVGARADRFKRIH